MNNYLHAFVNFFLIPFAKKWRHGRFKMRKTICTLSSYYLSLSFKMSDIYHGTTKMAYLELIKTASCLHGIKIFVCKSITYFRCNKHVLAFFQKMLLKHLIEPFFTFEVLSVFQNFSYWFKCGSQKNRSPLFEYPFR